MHILLTKPAVPKKVPVRREEPLILPLPTTPNPERKEPLVPTYPRVPVPVGTGYAPSSSLYSRRRTDGYTR